MNFKIGDVVQLRSGGPDMTIKHIGKQRHSEDLGVWCVWFESVGARHEVKEHVFDPTVLKPYEPSLGRLRVERG